MLNDKLREKTYHVIIVKSLSKTTYMGRRQTRMNISTIIEATPQITGAKPLLTIEGAPPVELTQEQLTISSPPTEGQPIHLTTPGATSEQSLLPKENKSETIQAQKSARRCLDAELAHGEEEFKKKMKSEIPTPSHKSAN